MDISTFVATNIYAQETPTGFPFIQIFYNGTQSVAGATAMTALIDGLAWCAVIGFLATASRMTWSFARDRGLPFHRFVSKVSTKSSIDFFFGICRNIV